MSLIATAGGSSHVAPIEEGTYPALCYLLCDLGSQYNETFKNKAHKCVIGWEIVGEYIEINGERQPRTMFNTYTMSLNEKSKLRKDLIPWRGRDFTDEELRAFNLRSIVGAPCLLQVIHREKNGKTYANIAGIVKLPKYMDKPTPELDPVVYDIDDNLISDVEYLPEWIAKQIKESEEYKLKAGMTSELTEIQDGDDEGNLPF